jgi:hypothetical protein
MKTMPIPFSLRFLRIVASACALAPAAALRADLIFDSWTPPPSVGGLSSANTGSTTLISVTQPTTLTNIAIRNEMLSTGDLKFLIFNEPAHQLIYQSAPVSFPIESDYSWKMSPALSLTLAAGQQYWVGYARDVNVNDQGDGTHESMNGITSVGEIATVPNYASPFWGSVLVTGPDGAIRLFAAPEPSTASLLTLASTALFVRSRRRSRAAH